MALPRFTLQQLLSSITWICVGFGLIAFSLRAWTLPLSPAYDWLANLEPAVTTSARVLGGTLIYWGIVLLLTPKPTADILIAAVVGVIPGMMVGLTLSHFLVAGDSGMHRAAAWIGMGICPGVILICLTCLRWARREPSEP